MCRYSGTALRKLQWLSLRKINQIGRYVRGNGDHSEAGSVAAPINQSGQSPLAGNQWATRVQKSGGAIRGLRKCVGLLLGSRDFVINGEYWMKSCLIARMECQEMPLMGSLPGWHRETGLDCMVTKQHKEEIIFIQIYFRTNWDWVLLSFFKT